MKKMNLSLSLSTKLVFVFFPALAAAQSFRAVSENPEDWKSPVKMTWQRTLDDAIALAKAQGRPLLFCVNMDKESACIQFATRKYRDVAFAKLCDPFVCVLASPNRHNPKDHDEKGRRIPCPKFGGITCGEHIAVEPLAYDRYFGGRRVAPRHLAVMVDGKVLFDRFLDVNLRRVDNALSDHQPEEAVVSVHPDDDDGLLASRNSHDRTAIEARYLAGNKTYRRQLLVKAAKTDSEPFELLLMGMKEEDAQLRDAAFDSLAATATRNALPLLLDALATRNKGRAALMSALARIEKADHLARRALTARRALDADSEQIKVSKWLSAIRNDSQQWPSDFVSSEEIPELDEKLDKLTKERASGGDPGTTNLAIAEANLRYALNRIQAGKDPSFLLMDAESAAKSAEKGGAAAWKSKALQARTAHLLGRAADASKLAAASLQGLVAEAGSPLAAAILGIVARQHTAQLYASPLEEEEDDYPSSSITEAHTAFSLLAQHPFGTEQQVIAHLDMLGYLGARRAAGAAVRTGLSRHPVSAAIHERFRNIVISEGGAAALEKAYATPSNEPGTRAALAWFSGYAFLIAAEQYVRDEKAQAAKRAYSRSVKDFGDSASANASYADSANHFAVLALGGLARLAVNAQDAASGVDLLLKAASLRPQSFSSEDGLGQSPAGTAEKLRELLRKNGDQELLARLNDGLPR